MESAESERQGTSLDSQMQSTDLEPPGGLKHEHMMQEGKQPEGRIPLQMDAYGTGPSTNKLSCSQPSMQSIEASAKDLLSSINARSVVLSGLYGTNIESSAKEMAPSMRAGHPVLSGLYRTDGVIKDLNTISGSTNPPVPSGVLNSHVNEMKMLGFHGVSKRPWLPSQKTQGNQVKNAEKEIAPSQASVRVARPPGEGRGKNQLLPRYWPRITDQELQLLATKDSNSTITPLFEKVLSASDAGKIGRLVLPKACAEAYFPYISQAEGVPITVEEVSGKEWTFQFRFWPNNNSRMYVLEGITPCIQSMQLQAGDTVIFSRRDPEGKLVMGYRRASKASSKEETQKLTAPSYASLAPPSQMAPTNQSRFTMAWNVSGSSHLSQPSKTSSKAPSVRTSGHNSELQGADAGYGWHRTGHAPSKKAKDDTPSSMTGSSEKRKTNEASTKSKRPRCDADSLDFKLNWEEAQSFLRAPPDVVPNIVVVEGYEFEEYEDPPIFGKEVSPVICPLKKPHKDFQYVKSEIQMEDMKAAKKQVLVEPVKATEPFAGLEALATLATAEETNDVASSSSSPATTTKHPRHRPGCSCIVCIQPPSGKGPKHKPNCDCNVCMTVKRRFHTLMLRRKKLQSEREAESSVQAQKLHGGGGANEVHLQQEVVKEAIEAYGPRRPNETGSSKNGSWPGNILPTSYYGPRAMDSFATHNGNGMPLSLSSGGSYVTSGIVKPAEPSSVASNKGPQFDLNSQPEREEEMNRGGVGGLGGLTTMKSLLQSASYPLEVYLKQQGLTSLEVPPEGMAMASEASSEKGDEHDDNPAPIMSSDGHDHDINAKSS